MNLHRLDQGWLAALTQLLAEEPHVAGYAAGVSSLLSDKASEVWACVNRERLAGVIVVTFGPFDAEIEMIVVDRQWRRQGVGKRLVHQAIKRAQALSLERVLLEVREGNAGARALYRAIGFEEDGLRPRYYPALQSGKEREGACLMSYGIALGSG